jgi:carbonic anhydrase
MVERQWEALKSELRRVQEGVERKEERKRGRKGVSFDLDSIQPFSRSVYTYPASLCVTPPLMKNDGASRR